MVKGHLSAHNCLNMKARFGASSSVFCCASEMVCFPEAEKVKYWSYMSFGAGTQVSSVSSLQQAGAPQFADVILRGKTTLYYH